MRRPLFLSGFMATGKSTVGRLLAERAGTAFVDLDQSIEQRTGRTVGELFRERGEAGFRALERDAVSQLIQAPGSASPVVAVGGGALLERELRLSVLDRAVVVTLDASLEEVLRRSASGPERPLLAVPDPAARVRELQQARNIAYSEAHARIATDGLNPAAVAELVLAVWRRDPLAVAVGERSYAVDIGDGVIEERLGASLHGIPSLILVTDSNVAPLHAGLVAAAAAKTHAPLATVVLEPGEQHKRTASVERIWNAALAAGADRSSLFIGLGGGVVTDITGFAAATWMRGVRWVALPTTLLAMVDASVGGKTGVDLRSAKNAVGAFWQPGAVLCDVATLTTEPERGYRSALAEIVKTALIGDAELYDLLEREASAVQNRDRNLVAEMVRRCIRVKARIVSFDERESGLRATLNLGHTVGHALESQGDYSRLTHGEAVSLGLVAALRIGERLGVTPAHLSRRTVELLRTLGLPTALEDEGLAAAAELIGHDKKRTGNRLKFIVARDIGKVDPLELGLAELRDHTRALARAAVTLPKVRG
jgi:shikimate kinase / 3-dehydroquinate synthase